MPKNVMKLLKRTANYARHDFDLSHRHLVTANFGELLPVTFIETVPEDYIEFSAADLLRAIPMVTSPFMRAKQHLDVWYVPYDYIWSNFSQFITQRKEPRTSQALGTAFIPYENLNYICSVLEGGSSLTDVVGRSFVPGAKKLYDLCGYGKFGYHSTQAPLDSLPSINLWRIAAYNFIWYHEYRQQYYDDGQRILDPDAPYATQALAWNFDDLTCTNSTNSRVANSPLGQASARIREMFQMRYRCWKKDLFTGLMPSTQFGAVSSVAGSFIGNGLPDFFLKQKNARVGELYGKGDGEYVVNSNASGSTMLFSADTGSGSAIKPTGSASVDILDLRKSQAVQIWRERALTAGNRVSDNLRAHYGTDVEYHDHHPAFLGSVSAPLQIQDINATSQNGSGVNQGLGDVAGKGTSTLSDKVFKFKAHNFGVIVAMFSLLPEAEYESNGIDRMNQLLEWEDYFIPEFQDLGLEGVSRGTFYQEAYNPGTLPIVGYAPRYWGYKQKLDKCFEGFKSSQPFAPWASPKSDVTQIFQSPFDAFPLSVLYVNPALFDRNFQVGVDNSEQFLCDMYFDVSAVRQMSPSGLPNY